MPSPAASPAGAPLSGLGLVVDEAGLARLTIDLPGQRSNRLSLAVLQELDRALAGLETLAMEGRARVLIVQSGKPGSFVAGSDLRELQELSDAEAASALALFGQDVLLRLERLPIPTIAAIDGLCLASGLELALACAYRVASDAPHTRLGLPQVQFGLVPGLGGTVRLPRLIGLQASLELIVTGRELEAHEARRVGVVDEVFATRHFPERVLRFAGQRAEQARGRRTPRRIARRVLEDTAPGRRIIFSRAARELLPRVSYAAPAPARALECVAESVSLPLEAAFRHEARVHGELVVGERARALLHSFRLLQDARRPAAHGTPQLEAAAVLGSGDAASEVAYLLARSGVPVRVRERQREALLRCVHRTLQRLTAGGERSDSTPVDAERLAELISGGAGFGGFGTVDLVVSALEGGEEGRIRALREAEEHTREQCLFAFAGPVASVTAAQDALERPDRLVALYPSRPVEHLTLVEVVPGRRTAPEVVSAACHIVRRLGRVPVVVADAPVTPAARLLGVYFAEASRLVAEGATVEQVDRLAEGIGFAIGPFRRMDLLGVKVAAAELHRLARAVGERMQPPPLVDRVADGAEGFYRYRNGKRVGTSPLLPRGVPDDGTGHAGLIHARLLLALINEAARVLEEGLLASAGTVDLVALAGLGFPRARGGLLFHAEQLGLERVVNSLHEHASRFGERYAPASLLQRLANEGRSVYSFAPAASGHAGGGVL